MANMVEHKLISVDQFEKNIATIDQMARAHIRHCLSDVTTQATEMESLENLIRENAFFIGYNHHGLKITEARAQTAQDKVEL